MFFQDFFLVPMDFYDDSNYLLQLKVILFEKVNKQQFNFKVPHIQILQMNRNAGGDEDEECEGVSNVFTVLISSEVKIITGETFESETLEGKQLRHSHFSVSVSVFVCVHFKPAEALLCSPSLHCITVCQPLERFSLDIKRCAAASPLEVSRHGREEVPHADGRPRHGDRAQRRRPRLPEGDGGAI
ncbi:hypothetical protein KC19_2G027600 [Ceratodon purpureus]|uniref:Uncharacterized protein n=1 Tax=Ceratodon purpureus TaxID=3225 RepID=A0A8T0IRJ6_CERPU|nr:hypothetical protein KC19_2G027600 [Ceratodon purpureus]